MKNTNISLAVLLALSTLSISTARADDFDNEGNLLLNRGGGSVIAGTSNKGGIAGAQAELKLGKTGLKLKNSEMRHNISGEIAIGTTNLGAIFKLNGEYSVIPKSNSKIPVGFAAEVNPVEVDRNLLRVGDVGVGATAKFYPDSTKTRVPDVVTILIHPASALIGTGATGSMGMTSVEIKNEAQFDKRLLNLAINTSAEIGALWNAGSNPVLNNGYTVALKAGASIRPVKNLNVGINTEYRDYNAQALNAPKDESGAVKTSEDPSINIGQDFRAGANASLAF